MEETFRKNLTRRLKTAGLGIPILIGVLFYAPDPVWWGVCAVALGLAAWELTGLTHESADRSGRGIGVALALTGFALGVLTRFGVAHGPIFGIGVMALVMISLLSALTRPRQIPRALTELAGYLLGVFYLGMMMATLALVRGFGTTTQGGWLAVLTLAIAWLSDSLAMAAGKSIGGPKLYAPISPNKTWSGTAGGLIGSLLSFLVVWKLFLPEFPFWRGMGLAFVAGACGQLGDLCESVLKRSAGVKDSGGLLPGHGGFLDRIDAVLFSALVVFAALQLHGLPFNSR